MLFPNGYQARAMGIIEIIGITHSAGLSDWTRLSTRQQIDLLIREIGKINLAIARHIIAAAILVYASACIERRGKKVFDHTVRVAPNDHIATSFRWSKFNPADGLAI